VAIDTLAAPPRRPPPGRQCSETAHTTGHRCGGWTLPGQSRCHTHTRQPLDALTAAVATVQLDGVAWQTYRFGSREWQTEAWRLYDITGPLRFVANWIGNSVSRCRLYVAEVGPDGEAGEEADDPDIAALASGPLGSGPAKDEALRLCAINLYVPGEGYIVAEAEAGTDGDDQWFVVSGRQIRRSGDQIVIRRSMLYGGGDMLYRPDVDLILRTWTPHPADTDEPDSPTRSAIPDLREIEALRKREFAELDSRLSGAGILPLPQEIDFPRGPEDPTGLQGFMNRLMQAMGTSLQDRSSAEAMVPIAITVPGEFLDKIKPVTFWSELSAQLLPLREGAVRSLARSLDIPPEVLLGQADSNHWTSWQTSEDAVTTQVVPILSRIADTLTTGYLRRALEQMDEDPDAYVYAFDTSPLTVRPNRTADALSYHEAGLLSDEAAVEAGAFRPDQMPAEIERVRRYVEKLVLANPALIAEPAIQDILGIESITITPPEPTPEPAPEDDDTPPVEEPNDIPDRPDQADDTAALVAVANLAVRRALSLAGGRLVPHTQRDRYPGTPRYQLHSRHGQISPDRADRVLRGAWDELPDVAADLGIDPRQLQALLHGFAAELLTRGMSFDPTLLRDLVRAAVHKRRLTAAPMGVAA
jgi:hypothetical protein